MSNTSYGVLCFNYDMTRVALIERSTSYAFIKAMTMIVANGNTRCLTVELLDKMYPYEKRLLYMGNFDYCLQYFDVSGRMRMRRRNYHDMFSGANGEMLNKLLAQSRRSSRPIIEVPKGHRKHNESDYDAGCREFFEETGIPLSSMQLFPRIKIKHVFSDEGVTYNYHIFPARLMNDTPYLPGYVDYGNRGQVQEVLSVHWYTLSELRALGRMDVPSGSVSLDYTARNARAIVKMFTRVKDLTRLQKKIPPSVDHLQSRIREMSIAPRVVINDDTGDDRDVSSSFTQVIRR